MNLHTFHTEVIIKPKTKKLIQEIETSIKHGKDPSTIYNRNLMGSFNFHGTKIFYWKDVFLDNCGYPYLEKRRDHPNFQKPIPKPITGKIEFKLTPFRLPRRAKMVFGFVDKFSKVRICKKIKIIPRQRNSECKVDFSGYLAYRILSPSRSKFRGNILSNKRHLSSFIQLRKASSNCATLLSGGCDTKYQLILRLRGHYYIPMLSMSNTLTYFATEQSQNINEWINISDCFGENDDKFEDNFAVGIEKDIIDDNVLAIPITKKAFITEI